MMYLPKKRRREIDMRKQKTKSTYIKAWRLCCFLLFVFNYQNLKAKFSNCQLKNLRSWIFTVPTSIIMDYVFFD